MPCTDKAGTACLLSLAGSAACGVAALVLAACSAPSTRLPSADEATRRPANSPEAVALQRCLGDGQSRQQALASALRRAEIAEREANLAASRQALLARCESAAQALARLPALPVPNQVFTVPFGTGSAALQLDDRLRADLQPAVQAAAWVVVRGRTDARHDSPAETVLARRRAWAAAELLKTWGVHGEHVRVQWQGAGDPAPGGPDISAPTDRRAEIEVYARRPLYHAAAAPPRAGSQADATPTSPAVPTP